MKKIKELKRDIHKAPPPNTTLMTLHRAKPPLFIRVKRWIKKCLF